MRHRLFEADVAGWVDPASVFSALFADDERAVWLDSGTGRGTSYLGRGSRLATASVAGGSVSVDGATAAGTIFEFLRAEPGAADAGAGEGFRLGWVGWLGYELHEQTMGMPPGPRSGRPDAALLFVDAAIAFDHAAGTMRVMATDADELAHLIADLKSVGERVPAPHVPSPTPARWRYSDEEYLAMIRACQAAIREGEAYQLCLTNEAVVDIRPDPLATWLALRESSPSHHGAFFRADGIALLSASPEQFLSVSPEGVVESKPIKGTRPRGTTDRRDRELAVELRSDEKERAENLMIVDLMRNDIARVSEVGSVEVPSLLAVESYAQVHQLVSTVRGRLRADLDPIDAVVACFPAGSMTGAPKRRAIEILGGLERRPRGVYSGAFGYFGLDGRVDLAMVIRSIVLDEHGATAGAGGGITALSVPEAELAEVKLKAAALLAALGASDGAGA